MWQTNLLSHTPWQLHIKFGFEWTSGFWEKDILKSVDNEQRQPRMDDGACLYYKLTYEPKGSAELKPHSKLSEKMLFKYLLF